MAVTRYYSSTAGRMILNGAVSAGATSITLDTVTGLPGTRPYTLMIDPGLSTEELVDVTAIGGLLATVVRGVDGTSAQAHLTGAEVRHCASGRDYQDSRNHEAATVAHGATGAIVGTTNVQALSNKSLSGTNNTFSGIPTTALANGPLSGTTGTFSGAVIIPTLAVSGAASVGSFTGNVTVAGTVSAGSLTTTGNVAADNTIYQTGETNALVGTGASVGTVKIIKEWSPIVATTSGAAWAASYPNGAFPNGITSIQATVCDTTGAGGAMAVPIRLSSCTLAAAAGFAFNTGGVGIVSTNIRISVRAVGW